MLRNNWITGFLILTMPISLIYFLGSQMAYGQVQRRHAVYTEIPEYTALAELQLLEVDTAVMLRGQLVDSSAETQATKPLLIYQERPLDGREVRYLEEFKLIFPELTLMLTDGTISAQPDLDAEQTISHEMRRVTIDDREFTGFQAGDMVTIQGKWQPAENTDTGPMIGNVTGISGVGKAVLLDEVQVALRKVSQARNGLGLLTAVSILLLALQLYFRKKDSSSDPQGGDDEHYIETISSPEEGQEWHPTTTESVPIS